MGGSSGSARGSTIWTVAAGAFLALQGFATILYAGFMPPPFTDAGVDVPFLGHLPFVWILLGVLAIVAAFGVLRRRVWGRYLGIALVILSIGTTLLISRNLASGAVSVLIDAVVLFALWRRWPTPGNAD